MSDPSLPPAPPVDVHEPSGGDPFRGSMPYRLIGPAERQHYSPLLTAALGGLVAFFVFQGVALLATGLLLAGQLTAIPDADALPALLAANSSLVFTANAIGQVVGLGMFGILLARLHTPDVLAYLRVRSMPAPDLGLSVVGLFALLPVVSFLGTLAEQLPWPEALRAWDAQQQALVAQVLGGDLNVALALLLVAVTPAICEEVLFRGFIQRNVERRFSPVAAIVIVGFAFGLFHLRFVELLPLALLGAYIAFTVWVTGSLWAGVIVHLFNNGTAILLSNWANTRPDPIALDAVVTPWYLALAGAAVALFVVQTMRRRRADRLAPPL